MQFNHTHSHPCLHLCHRHVMSCHRSFHQYVSEQIASARRDLQCCHKEYHVQLQPSPFSMYYNIYIWHMTGRLIVWYAMVATIDTASTYGMVIVLGALVVALVYQMVGGSSNTATTSYRRSIRY
jgi:hypothetical protein